MNRFAKFLWHMFFPNRCPFCKTCITADQFCCDECRKMAEGEPFVSELVQTQPASYDARISLYEYSGKCAETVKSMKFNGWEQFSAPLGYFLSRGVAQPELVFDLVAYVPCTKKRHRQRGFNQAEKLAACVSRHSGKPVTHTLVKLRDTEEQHALSKEKRYHNLSGAFSVCHPGELTGKSVLLIDDVFTTGTTMNECAGALKKAGAVRVIACTVCATSPFHSELTA